MATPEQIAANRRNAQHSTGPRTPEGKSITRFNALQHAIFADAHILIGENRCAFEALRDDYLGRYQPAAPEEELLVSNLVNHSWLLVRFRKTDADIWNQRLQEGPRNGEPHPLGRVHPLVYKQGDSLQRRINSTHRQFHRDLDRLNHLQADRKLVRDSPGLGHGAPGDLAVQHPASTPAPNAPLDPEFPQPLASEIGSVPINSLNAQPDAATSSRVGIRENGDLLLSPRATPKKAAPAPGSIRQRESPQSLASEIGSVPTNLEDPRNVPSLRLTATADPPTLAPFESPIGLSSLRGNVINHTVHLGTSSH